MQEKLRPRAAEHLLKHPSNILWAKASEGSNPLGCVPGEPTPTSRAHLHEGILQLGAGSLDAVTAPDGTTTRHAQRVPPGAAPLPAKSLGEVAVFEGWSPACTRELFLMMAPTPEDPDEVRAVGQKGALGA